MESRKLARPDSHANHTVHGQESHHHHHKNKEHHGPGHGPHRHSIGGHGHDHNHLEKTKSHHNKRRPDSRLGHRGAWDNPEENRKLKNKIEQQKILDEATNSHRIIQHLVKRTHFNTDQVKSLMNIYKKLTSLGKMDRLRFRDVLYSTFDITDDVILDRTFGTFDGDSEGSVNEREWIIGMSAFLRGTLEEQIAYVYEVYDFNGDRSIGREEVHQLIRHCISPLPGIGLHAIDPEEVADASRDIVEMVVQKLDVDHNGIITYGDFHDACTRDPTMLESLGSCLPSPKQLQAFLAIFADDYNVFASNYSHPSDLGWDRERDRFARREEINAILKLQHRSETGMPLISYRDSRKKTVTDLNAARNRKRTLQKFGMSGRR